MEVVIADRLFRIEFFAGMSEFKRTQDLFLGQWPSSLSKVLHYKSPVYGFLVYFALHAIEHLLE